jgi:hypothetical protein
MVPLISSFWVHGMIWFSRIGQYQVHYTHLQYYLVSFFLRKQKIKNTCRTDRSIENVAFRTAWHGVLNIFTSVISLGGWLSS